MVAAAGPVSLAVEAFRELFGSSSTTQTWTGTSSEATAKLRAYVESQPASGPVQAVLPCVVVHPKEVMVRRGGYVGGILGFIFYAKVDNAYQGDYVADIDAFYAFVNNVGQIVSDMMSEADNSGRLIIIDDTFKQVDRPRRPRKNEEDDYYEWEWELHWGSQLAGGED